MGLPIRGVPIRDESTGAIIGQYFEPSDEFRSFVSRGMNTATRIDGKIVRVNRKLARNGHYSDRPGFDIPAEVKPIQLINAPLAVPMKEKAK